MQWKLIFLFLGASVCLALQKGASIVRVHDVPQISQMISIFQAVQGNNQTQISFCQEEEKK